MDARLERMHARQRKYEQMEKRVASLHNRLSELSDQEIETIIELSDMKFDEEEKETVKELVKKIPHVHGGHFKRHSFGEREHANRHDPNPSYLDQIIYRLQYYGKRPDDSTFTDVDLFSGKRKIRSRKHKKSHSRKHKSRSRKHKSRK